MLKKTFSTWLPLAVAIAVLSGLVFVAVQQDYRMSANDPQIQIAEDVAQAIVSNKASPDSIVPPEPTVDITQSLATFVAIYSATGTPIGSSVAIDGKLPVVPSGVLDKALANGENRLTWQPKAGARFAVVVASFGGKEPGFVLVGRSLKEVENREHQLAILVAVGAAVAWLLTFAAVFFVSKCATKTSSTAEETKPTEPQA